MKKLIRIINGPNLNLLGTREPDVYGKQSFESYLEALSQSYSDVEVSYRQSNWEGGVIDLLHEANKEVQGVILNAGAYSHTSIAIADAVAAVSIPVVAVHISNIYARELERHTDLLAKYCRGNLSGFGLRGYEMALRFLMDEISAK